MKIHKDNVLLTSIDQLQKVNLHKELKFEIVGDKVSDAGGLLREWMYLITNEIFHPNTGNFFYFRKNLFKGI